MWNLRAATVSAGIASALLAGCGQSGTTKTPAPAATVAIPANLFGASAPADAVPLLDAKKEASAGERIVFTARVGGRRTPFVENRAVFFVADPSLESCDQLEGDTCKYPWDYCCEPADSLTRHMATVQVVDGAGQPLKVTLENAHGLAPLKTIYVSGTVQSDDASNFVVVADSIYVQEG